MDPKRTFGRMLSSPRPSVFSSIKTFVMARTDFRAHPPTVTARYVAFIGDENAGLRFRLPPIGKGTAHAKASPFQTDKITKRSPPRRGTKSSRASKTATLWISARRDLEKGATGKRQVAAVVPNVLDRSFEAPAPNRKWITDFTYVWTAEGWLYVAAVVDLFSRRVIGWSVNTAMTAQLVTDALVKAVAGDHSAPINVEQR